MNARTISLSGMVFAQDATTVIPSTPQAGVTYRDESYSKTRAADGWAYYRVCNSAEFNQMMFKLTSMVDEMEKSGLLVWSQNTDYPVGGITRDPDDDLLYEATAVSGPNSGGYKKPLDNVGTYWKKMDLGLGGYAVQFVSGSNVSPAQAGRLYYCISGGRTITLPTNHLETGMKVRISTGGNITTASYITVAGNIENQTDLIISDPYSGVELIYDGDVSTWRVCNPVVGIPGQ